MQQVPRKLSELDELGVFSCPAARLESLLVPGCNIFSENI